MIFLEATVPIQAEVVLEETAYIFDRIVADVTGDLIDDYIYLAGNKESPESMQQEDITLYVVDGLTNELYEQKLLFNSGNNSALFIGDFNKDHVADVFVSIDSNKDAKDNYYYIYSFKDKEQKSLLESNDLSKLYQWEISFTNGYGLQIENQTLNQMFHLDISDLDEESLSHFYKRNSKVKDSAAGHVIALENLTPVMDKNGNQMYNLIVSQPIIGTDPMIHLGTIEIHMTYEEGQFTPVEIVIGNRIKLK